MKPEQITVGTLVETTQSLRYGTDDQLVQTILKGTQGVIVEVEFRDSWSLVRVRFDGHRRVYSCDASVALSAMTVKEGRPTVTHIAAADSTAFTVTTSVKDGTLFVALFDHDKSLTDPIYTMERSMRARHGAKS